jgi:carbonic anhydrase/acetyltransferase-like protein (isoleucine patch superfamily)
VHGVKRASAYAGPSPVGRPLMAHIVELDGVTPTIGKEVYLAPTAVLVGDVRIGDRANVWFGAVLRADSERIEVGARSSIQDNVVIHCADGLPTIVGEDVTVGHAAMLEGCVVGDGALIGMGAIVLQRAEVGERALIAAGGVVAEGQRVAPGMLAAGVPVKEKKPLSGGSERWSETAGEKYQQLRERYLRTSTARSWDGSSTV